MSSRRNRLSLMRKIAELRQSIVLAFITGDRPNMEAQIGDDAVRHFYQHLRDLGPINKLDLFLYSRGGASDVPWRLVSGIRNICNSWAVLIPYRANSAATMIALGADEVVMGPQAELGPIDPSLTTSHPGEDQTSRYTNVSVEDVMAYVQFMQERVGLSDQSVLADGLGRLTDRIDAVALGNVHRTHSHIRDVALRILMSRSESPAEAIANNIVSTLAERVYAHGHAITIQEATDIGLPTTQPSPDLERAMWSLLQEYEDRMKLLTPFDPFKVLANAGSAPQALEENVLAIIESEIGIHEYRMNVRITPKREIPQSLQVAINLNPQVPADLAPEMESMLPFLLKQIEENINQRVALEVRQALEDQAPILGVDVATQNDGWVFY